MIDLRQSLGQRARDQRDVARFELNVRVALRMHIALRAVHGLRHLELGDEIRCHEIAWLADLDFAVARGLQQNREPAHFQFGPGAYQQVGCASVCNQAGARLDAMRIRLNSDRFQSSIAAARHGV